MIRGAHVTPGFFRSLGVSVTAGRDFAPDEGHTGVATVAIVSAGFARQLGQAPLTETVTVNGTPYTVVGVLPRSFHFAVLQNADIFLPLVADGARRTDRGDRSVHVVGRLRAGITADAANDELAAVMDGLARAHPQVQGGRTARAVPLRDALLGPARPIMTALLLAVALLLLIMTANLALLMLTRYVERLPELAMRSALGATRGRVLRQLAIEAQAPALLGVALAVLVAESGLKGVLASIPASVQIGMPYLAAAAIDARMIGLMVGTAAVLALIFGIGPALFLPVARGRPGNVRTTASRADRRLRRGLVVTQLAVTTVLLAASGLLVTSFINLVRRDLGYHDPATIVTARAPLSGQRYQEPVAQQSFYEALVARSAALPGVTLVGLVDEVPGGGGGAVTYETVDHPPPPAERPRAALRIAGGDYFGAMRIPVLAGRTFEPRDRADAPRVAVVSAALARLLSSDGEAVGRRLRLAGAGDHEWEVIGIVGDVPVSGFDVEPPPVIYLSHLQRAENRLTLVMRAERSDASLAPDLRSIVAEQDPGVPVYAVATLERQMRDSRAVLTRRLPMVLCGVFSVAALLLTLVALYAVCIHEVLSRRREFGIRLALGANAASIRQVILRSTIQLGALGIAAGTLAALLASRLLGSLMFGIATTDWRAYTLVAMAVLGVTLLAAVGPVLRAGGIDPAEVMRTE
jgi:putative ABC transport system permease protein